MAYMLSTALKTISLKTYSSLKPFFISARGVISIVALMRNLTMCWVVSDELFPLDRFSDLFPCIN